MSRQQLSIHTKTNINRITNDKIPQNDHKEMLNEFEEPLKEAKQNIERYLGGEKLQQPKPAKPKQKPKKSEEPKIGQHIITLWY